MRDKDFNSLLFEVIYWFHCCSCGWFWRIWVSQDTPSHGRLHCLKQAGSWLGTDDRIQCLSSMSLKQNHENRQLKHHWAFLESIGCKGSFLLVLALLKLFFLQWWKHFICSFREVSFFTSLQRYSCLFSLVDRIHHLYHCLWNTSKSILKLQWVWSLLHRLQSVGSSNLQALPDRIF